MFLVRRRGAQVDAKGYLFIHCIWVSPNTYKEKGHGSRLVNECITNAKQEDKYGVAVVTSEGSFMVGKALFLKNRFKRILKNLLFEPAKFICN